MQLAVEQSRRDQSTIASSVFWYLFIVFGIYLFIYSSWFSIYLLIVFDSVFIHLHPSHEPCILY